MTVYFIFTRERLRDKSEMDTYTKLVGPTLQGHPVKPLAAYGKHETVEGAPIDGAVVLEFPTVEAAKAWYNSPAYQEVVRHRFAGADYRAFITEGV